MKKKKDFNYYEQFEKASNLAEDAARKLKEYVANYNHATAAEQKKKIHAIENQADTILHDVKMYLLKDFLPPIDREDIIAIAHRIDDLVDAIDEVAINLDIFLIDHIRDDMKTTVDKLKITVATTNELVATINNLKSAEAIKAKVVEVNQLEEQADKLYENSVRELYKTETNPIEILKWSKMYSKLEDCFDACENVAECVEEVLLKNA